MLKNDKIFFEKTKDENLDRILILEKDNCRFVTEYSLEEHKNIMNRECHLSIFDSNSKDFIGYIILVGVKTKIIEFRRIVILKKGLGYGKQAVKLTKQLCFKGFNASKIWLDVYDDNKNAIKLYEAQGFLKEDSVLYNNRKLRIMAIANSSDNTKRHG
jgi:ribosomal protein S18 acetylase RimI-like enzyme